MSQIHRVGVIGAGRPWRTEGATGSGMSHAHARGYRAIERCSLVAVADIKEENARAFADEYQIPGIYTNYREMLARENLDIVSIATWPALHAEMTMAAAEAGVKAVHCEKPMAPTWGEARAMAEACRCSGTQLTFNHQRRFCDTFQLAKEIVQSGEIGDLVRIEGVCSNLYDWGTHWFDMFFFYNNETPAEWVLGQVDGRDSRTIFGVPVEGQGMSLFRFQNGVKGYLETGYEAGIGATHRITGSRGTIEIHEQQPHIRYRGKRIGVPQVVETKDGLHGDNAITAGIRDLVSCLETGAVPLLSGDNALRTTEVIMATYESSRRRGRVDLPLDVDDNAFAAGL